MTQRAIIPPIVDELAVGFEALTARHRDDLTRFLQDVASVRRGPLHLCSAFNAVYFGFDLHQGFYSDAVLEPDAFTVVRPGRVSPVPPVGAFMRMERGSHTLWGEVSASFGAAGGVDEDGWTPNALSGAAVADEESAVEARSVVDWEAFGLLTAGEHRELDRLRRSDSRVVDHLGHLMGPTASCGALSGRDQSASYRHHLLHDGRPLLAAGAWGGMLRDPSGSAAMERALEQCFGAIWQLMQQAQDLVVWDLYAQPAGRHEAFAGSAVATEMVSRFSRPAPGGGPRYTALWPVLTSWQRHDDEAGQSLALTAAAAAVVDSNLMLAAHVTGGRVRNGVDLRIDDGWQQGGIWRAQALPVDPVLADCDPLTPAGVGRLEYLRSAGSRVSDTGAQQEGFSDVRVQHLDGSLVVATVALAGSDLLAGRLPLSRQVMALLARGPLRVDLHHAGQDLDAGLACQKPERTSDALTGMEWPSSFYPGIKITVAAARAGSRLTATTALLPEPVIVDSRALAWEFDPELLALAFRRSPFELAHNHTQSPSARRGTGYRPPVTALERLITASLLRDGRVGPAESRSLNGRELSGAMFGPEVTTPPLLWTVIHTCEELARQGILSQPQSWRVSGRSRYSPGGLTLMKPSKLVAPRSAQI